MFFIYIKINLLLSSKYADLLKFNAVSSFYVYINLSLCVGGWVGRCKNTANLSVIQMQFTAISECLLKETQSLH